MCGIFAVMGVQEAPKKVLAGLKKMEYRGYDSWGVGGITTDGEFFMQKDTGKISQVSNDTEFPESSLSMGHTRWATHGGVTQKNAHPHQSGAVMVVHNGVGENFEALKTQLPAGTKYQSDTDTEVVAALIDHLYEKEKSPLSALTQALQKIEGRLALVVFFRGKNELWAVRRGSPLIVGRAEQSCFVASDIPAFLEHTNQVNYLEDQEIVCVSNADAQFFSGIDGSPIEKRTITVPWRNNDQDHKGEYPHFMLKEIFEQRDTLRASTEQSVATIQKGAELMNAADEIYFIGCGTAHKMAAAGEYFLSGLSQRSARVVAGSEMPHFWPFLNKKSLIIALSQSGETADILESVEAAQTRGAKILAITNTESSSLARLADHVVPLLVGTERAVASTKAATAMLAVELLLAYALRGEINQGREVLRSTIANITDLLNPRYEEPIQQVTASLAAHDKLYIIGRGPLYPIALEAAIKIQEVSYIHAHGLAAGELKHGPIALIEKGTPCMVLGENLSTLSNAAEIAARGGFIIGISPHQQAVFDQWIRVPDCGWGQSIASLIPLQMLSYQLGLQRGVDPDMPRNLAKSVTVK